MKLDGQMEASVTNLFTAIREGGGYVTSILLYDLNMRMIENQGKRSEGGGGAGVYFRKIRRATT